MSESALPPNLDERHVGVVVDRDKVKTAIALDEVTAVVRYESCPMPAGYRPEVSSLSTRTLAVHPPIRARLHLDADLAIWRTRYMNTWRRQRSIRGRLRHGQQAEWQSNQCKNAGHSLDAQRVPITRASKPTPTRLLASVWIGGWAST